MSIFTAKERKQLNDVELVYTLASQSGSVEDTMQLAQCKLSLREITATADHRMNAPARVCGKRKPTADADIEYGSVLCD